jgi:dephospho-CoA kinase
VKEDPVRIGLTGGIGSGKSTVAAMLEKMGATIIDADAISRAATAKDGSALREVAMAFGPEFISSDGALDRQKMREIAFRDSSVKKKLEDILHPIVRREMLAQADLAESLGAACIAFDIPLLVESNAWRSSFNSVLVVDCTVDTQLFRVKERSGLPEDDVRRIISAQASRFDRLRSADIVVFNDYCSLEQLAGSVQSIASEIGL